MIATIITERELREFQYRGGSPGGARPKIFTRYDGERMVGEVRAKRIPNILVRMNTVIRFLPKSVE